MLKELYVIVEREAKDLDNFWYVTRETPTIETQPGRVLGKVEVEYDETLDDGELIGAISNFRLLEVTDLDAAQMICVYFETEDDSVEQYRYELLRERVEAKL